MAVGYSIRKNSRFNTMYHVYYRGPDFIGNGVVHEISLGGCRIEGDHFVYPGLILSLAVFLPDEPKAVRVENAVVRWTRGSLFGLRTLRITFDESDRLARAITTLVQQRFMLVPLPHSPALPTSGNLSVAERNIL